MKHDAVVIGSGVSGMTSAIALAKAGRDVLVLEQHAIPGGLMQVFRRDGCLFSTGVHLLGGTAPGQVLRRYFKFLGVLDRLELDPMPDDGFMRYLFPGLEFIVPPDREAFRDRLCETFPNDRAPIRAFFRRMAEVVSQFSLYTLSDRAENPALQASAVSVAQYIGALGCSPETAAILTALNSFVGIAPRDCPFYVYCLVLDSFLHGAARVREHATPMAGAFEAALRDAGGALRTGAHVEAVLHADGRVTGVELAGGERIDCDLVVFTGHPRQLDTLCAEGAFRPLFRERLRNAPDTGGVIGVGVAWDGPASPVDRCDAIAFRTLDTNSHYAQPVCEEDGWADCVYCTGIREGDGPAASLAALAFSPDGAWSRWADTRVGRRPSEYRARKERAAEHILGLLTRYWPEAAPHMRVVDVYTPLTLRDYTLSSGGSAYGLQRSVRALRQVRLGAATRLEGLVLAGQSVILSGILGSVISGINACCHVLGRQELVARIESETS